MPKLHDDELDDLLAQEPDPTLAERVAHLSRRLEPVRHRTPPPHEPAASLPPEPDR